MEEQEPKKQYELAFLLKEEEAAAELIADLKSMGAEIGLEGSVRKIALAYEIKKETSAFFGFVQFMMDPAQAKALEASLRMRAGLLRSMLITPPTAKEKSAQSQTMSTGQRPPASKTYEPKPATGLSNEALEKTIEEILK